MQLAWALVVVSEVGADMSRFSSVKHFASWLGLCPGTKITGGKVMSGKTRRCVNRASQALRSSKSALGAACLKTNFQINHLAGVS